MDRRFRCPGCGYVYDEQAGDPHEGFPAGTRWERIPDDWACPDCAVREKADFTQIVGTGAASGPPAAAQKSLRQ